MSPPCKAEQRLRAQQVLPVQWVRKAQLALMVREDPKAQLVLVVRKVLPVLMALLARQDRKVLKVQSGHKVLPVLMARLANAVLLAQMVLQARLGHKGSKVQ